jgi:hypothetical protein
MIPSVTKTEYKIRGSIKNSATGSAKRSGINHRDSLPRRRKGLFVYGCNFESVGGTVVKEKAMPVKRGSKFVFEVQESSFPFPSCSV